MGEKVQRKYTKLVSGVINKPDIQLSIEEVSQDSPMSKTPSIKGIHQQDKNHS